MTRVQIKNVRQSFAGVPVLRDVSLAIDSGTYVVLLGPSGSGKTTILRTIAGLQRPDGGDVLFDDQSILGLPPRRRDVSLVVQQGGLYPHRTIGQSMRMPLPGKLSRLETEARIEEAIRLTKIQKLVDRRPGQLSGGELRRAAIAKAIARRASVRLLDEPLSALDGPVREMLQQDLLRWHHQVPGTTIHVTHDGQEAIRMADKLAVIEKGQIIQFASPDEIYCNPASVTVAQSLGSPAINLIRCTIRNRQLHAMNSALSIVWQVDLPDGEAWIGSRQENWIVGIDKGQLRYSGQVRRIVRSAGRLQIEVSDGESTIWAFAEVGLPVSIGDPICIGSQAKDAMLFDANTELRLL